MSPYFFKYFITFFIFWVGIPIFSRNFFNNLNDLEINFATFTDLDAL